MSSALNDHVEAIAQRSDASESPAAAAVSSGRPRPWQRTLVRTIGIVDLLIAVMVVTGAAVLGDLTHRWDIDSSVALGAASLLLVVAAMAGTRCWDSGVLGQGSDEFNRVLRAFVASSLLLAVAGLAFKVDSVRPWVFGVVPAIGATILCGRYLVRRVLHAARRESYCLSSVLVVGTPSAVSDINARTQRVPHHGWTVTAACTPSGLGWDDGTDVFGVPVVGDLDDVAHCVAELDIDVVAVAPAPGWSPKRLHRLAWQLEGTGVELVVDPGLMEISGPRLHMAPVDGLPLLRLTEPRFSGAARIAKNTIDRVVAASLVLMLAPVLLTIALLVRKDGGPAFYRQERVGLGGRTFRMVKFRSMVVDADRVKDTLELANEGAGPLFKMKRDPRVTRVGGVLRRLSIDELPQLFNVIGGSMSLVGPRPPLQREVDEFCDDARRKLLVRPGMTGLWQVSGRSDLSWEESVRMDLRYVENWSPALDASILWKTVGAVFKGRGAY